MSSAIGASSPRSIRPRHAASTTIAKPTPRSAAATASVPLSTRSRSCTRSVITRPPAPRKRHGLPSSAPTAVMPAYLRLLRTGRA
ncbi:hypothetical protein WM04_03570 [Burkholderia ubonensis]|nr:hypothetical protein WM04_03570 [Burkholderia ubonensis]OJB20952.1 hypothetical protein BGV53_01240 [Burkholderia ubonensis]